MAFQPALKPIGSNKKRTKPPGVCLRLLNGSKWQAPYLRIRMNAEAVASANLKPKDKVAIEFDPDTFRVAICRNTEGRTLQNNGTTGSLVLNVPESRLDDGFLADLKALNIDPDKTWFTPSVGMLVINLTEDAK